MELLKQLYSIHVPTFHEWPMITFIRDYVDKHIPEADLRMDSWGNLYIKKEAPLFALPLDSSLFTHHSSLSTGYPTLACHLDQVQTIHSDDFCVKEEDGKLYGWSETNQQREGLGADDKNGIWISLRCLEECPRLMVFMAVGEEKGCIGSNRADMSFFADSLYVLELDCKGGTEIHTNLRGIPCASEDFNTALQAETNGFTITDGKTSDIFALTLNGIGVSCANIPAGYHLPHKDDEYTVIAELEHTLSFIRHFVTMEHHRFPHVFKTYTQQMIESESKQ